MPTVARAAMQVTSATSMSTCADAPSRALADVGNALTSGSDATVLKAALANRTRLLACGLTRQAVSTELIAADAYGDDVNEPKQRCVALHSARNESLKIGDTSRADLIERTLRGC